VVDARVRVVLAHVVLVLGDKAVLGGGRAADAEDDLPLQHREYLLVANEVHHLLVHELAVQLGQKPAVPDHQFVQSLFVLQVGVFYGDAVIYQ